MVAHEWISYFLMCCESKAEWQCNMSMTKYSKCESNELWSIKWMRWTMVDELNEMGCGRYNKWGFGKMILQHKHNWSGVHKLKQDGETRSLPSDGLVVKSLDSYSWGPVFKTTGWLQGWLNLSSFQGW